MNKALDYSNKLALMDKQIESLWKQQNDLMEMSNSIQQQLDMLERYKALYVKWTTGGTINPEEQIDLLTYRAMFGERPPEYTSQELFDKFIKNRDFPHYSVWAAVKNLQKNKELTISSIKISTKQVFDGIIDMEDALLLQNELYSTMVTQNKHMLLKFNAGLISEIDKFASDSSLEKQRLSVEKLKRSLDNFEMSLKRQLGIPLKQEIDLIAYDNSKDIKAELPYSEYLKKALENRAEILIARMDLQVKQREDDIMKQYITCEVVDERMESIQSLEEKKIAHTEAIEKVTEDIAYGYKDVKSKLDYVSLMKRKLQNSKKDLENSTLQYKNGVISYSNLLNIEITNTQVQLAYSKSIRDYNNALYKLETACGIGPGYSSNLGGN